MDEEGEATGIKLPYIVTMDGDSGKILSVVRNYREHDPMRRKRDYFVHFKFLPGFGFYGFGLTAYDRRIISCCHIYSPSAY
jgi:hypothetical protein